jgi:hypothetical protein
MTPARLREISNEIKLNIDPHIARAIISDIKALVVARNAALGDALEATMARNKVLDSIGQRCRCCADTALGKIYPVDEEF